MYPNPMRVTQIGHGCLYIMSKPTGGEYLSDDVAYLARNGITHVVSLLEHAEASELGLSAEDDFCNLHGIRFEQFPIADRSIPNSIQRFVNSLARSLESLSSGAHLVAHCRAGIGRSGIYATSLLIRYGFAAQDAFALVSEARGITIPDTQAQIDWIHANEKELRVLSQEQAAGRGPFDYTGEQPMNGYYLYVTLPAAAPTCPTSHQHQSKAVSGTDG